MASDPAYRDHQAWLGYLQPDGLVVSPTALVGAQVFLERSALAQRQQAFLGCVGEFESEEDTGAALREVRAFLEGFLHWPADHVFGFEPDRPLPEDLCVPLSDFGETLAPQFALCDRRREGEAPGWLVLGQIVPRGADLDAVHATGTEWPASPARRLERLLRETRVPIGLLTNGTHIRLIYAPRGENTGSLTFPVQAMTEVAGRPIVGALHLLLDRYRLLAAPDGQRLPQLLKASRDYQSTVSTALAEQVLEALYELLRGFQAADVHARGRLLAEALAREPDQVYASLLTVLLRLVFLLYAEDRGLMPSGALYVRHYSVHGLFERLRADHERYPDTMHSRYGAWAQLLALFRAVHGGCDQSQLRMPARQGYLFDPRRYPFLEGRSVPEGRMPLVADGVVFAVLRRLLILDGERLSYRTLDVEQIGSVYESVMGFRLEVATGPTIAIRPAKPQGAPAAIDLGRLLAVTAAERAGWLKEATDQKLAGRALEALKAARTQEDLLAALEAKIARAATPEVVPKGGMVLQPSDERRRSGSHYTPRTLTGPIVRMALRPVLERLGPAPTPKQLLELKLADIAVGSGAFLVETCRQLADELVRAWHHHDALPLIPADEDELLHARRLIAQRCLYGVDRNPMAVDLAKLSLWLATLARDHPFTFLDHALRWGDSLVGLDARQLADFHWQEVPQRAIDQGQLEERIEAATRHRRAILEADDEFVSPEEKLQKLRLADEQLLTARLAGDCVIAAFFSADAERARADRRDALLARFTEFYRSYQPELNPEAISEELRRGPLPVLPFHWQIEFPEVFARENGGFDAIVGNPPFAGKNTLINGNRAGYLDWLKALHPDSHGNSDLVAHFFRRAFGLLRRDGCFGLIATNTIGQGDTRYTGLRWIATHGGTIYAARKRYKWPGQAAVVVSVVHVARGARPGPHELDGRSVPLITAFLFHAGSHETPKTLKANEGKSFQGSIVLGMGFTFDDTDTSGVASPVSLMHELIAKDPRNAERIFPYIGGEEVNVSPTHAHRRYVINFGDMSEEEARRWPDLMKIVEEKVRPARMRDNREVRKKYWWRFGETTPALFAAIAGLERVLVINCGATPHMAFAFLPAEMVYANTLDVFPLPTHAAFCALQSRPHEIWARFFGSSMKDDLRYTPSDCFETFPFPESWETHAALEAAGQTYYDFRAALMVRNNEGLTPTYNRFHDPDEQSPDIVRLRELHAAMDRAVLDAYGWGDLRPVAEFIPEHEDEEAEDSRRRRSWRLRWPDEARDELLARLLALNAERAQQESLEGDVPRRGRGRVRARIETQGALDL